MNDLIVDAISKDSNANQHTALKCLETALGHPYTSIAIISMLCGTFLTLTIINAKYGRETTISYDSNDGFTYVSKPATTNNSSSVST